MTVFSRHAKTHPLGLLDTPLKTEIPEQMHDDFVFMAGLHGKTKAELLRDMVDEFLYGSLRVARSHATKSIVRAVNSRETEQ